MTIRKTLGQLLAEDPDLEYRLKADGKWRKVSTAWADGSVPLSVDGVVRGVHPWKFPLSQDRDLDEPRPPIGPRSKRIA